MELGRAAPSGWVRCREILPWKLRRSLKSSREAESANGRESTRIRMQGGWHIVENVNEVPSPALLIYPDRIAENIRRMISAVNGDVGRLRPHIKTHKLPELIALQMRQGITRFKCATIAEAEMLGMAGASDVLLGYQPVGPNIGRLAELLRIFPKTIFSAVDDNEQSCQ